MVPMPHDQFVKIAAQLYALYSSDFLNFQNSEDTEYERGFRSGTRAAFRYLVQDDTPAELAFVLAYYYLTAASSEAPSNGTTYLDSSVLEQYLNEHFGTSKADLNDFTQTLAMGLSESQKVYLNRAVSAASLDHDLLEARKKEKQALNQPVSPSDIDEYTSSSDDDSESQETEDTRPADEDPLSYDDLIFPPQDKTNIAEETVNPDLGDSDGG